MHCGDQRHAGLCLGRRPCTSRRRVQGRSQGTTLNASDLHNARATILNPFYNMEHKIIKKIRQNMTWIEEDILGINFTPTGTMHSSQPLSTSAMTSQSHSTQWRHNNNTTLLRAHVNGTEIVLKSTDRRSNISPFLYVQVLIHGSLIVVISKVMRLNCFSKMWHIPLPRILQNNDLQC